MLTSDRLRTIMPSLSPARAALWLPPLVAATAEFKIDTPARLAAFLAQLAHESGELAHVVENLNYSAAGMIATWPTRFGHGRGATAAQRAAGKALAQRLARKPIAIANYVYADRMGNGPERSGDGWRYRGRGPIMNTGKDAYERLGRALCLPLVEQPELLEQPGAGARAAGWFWLSRGLNQMADVVPGETETERLADFKVICHTVNGGDKGLAERIAFWERAKRVLAA